MFLVGRGTVTYSFFCKFEPKKGVIVFGVEALVGFLIIWTIRKRHQ